MRRLAAWQEVRREVRERRHRHDREDSL